MKRSRINWEEVRERLRASESALEEALSESPERIEAAYRLRAARLAKGEAERKPASAALPVLVFWLAHERYAIELKDLVEVLPFARCMPAPGAPPQFRGVINVRGELRAVVDLHRLLALSDGSGDPGFVLMLRHPGQEVGLKVDRIEELREIRPEELTPPSQGNYVKGVTSDVLMLLNAKATLAEVFSKGESLTT